MKNIFVLYTGGTIGMQHSANGLRPSNTTLANALKAYSGSLNMDWHACQPLIDSSALTPHHWANWLNLIQQKLPDYDGVLVLHGTDTLAYTANLLALYFNHWRKPIILTGAQKPFGHANSDAPANIQTAINALQNERVQEVLLAFNGQLWPAIGSSKISTERDDGFANSHFGVWLKPQHSGSLNAKLAANRSQFSPEINIANCFFTPTQNGAWLAQSLNQQPIDGVILQSYGHGNAPHDERLLSALKTIHQQGKLLLNISQVPQGRAAAVYEQNHALRQAGVINGGKCNIETATALMLLACSNHWTATQLQTELKHWQLIE